MSNENETFLICNGELEVLRVKENLFDDVVKFSKTDFMINEPLNKALGLSAFEDVNEDAEVTIRNCLQDEVSFAVRNCKTKEIVAARICRILTPTTDSCDYLVPEVSDFFRRLKTPFNIYKEWNIDCALEFFFLSTRADYSGRGLATLLSQEAIGFARRMLNGTLKEHETLPAHVKDFKPKAVCSMFTSKFTQKMGEKLGMQVLVKIPYTEFIYNGKSFADTMDPIHECATFVAMKL